MDRPIFDSFVEPKKATRKWLFLPLSVLLHGFVVALIIVAPLLRADTNLPALKIQVVQFVAAPAPPTAPPAAAPRRTSTNARRNQEQEQREARPVSDGRFVAPIVVPDEIVEEDVEDWGIDGGIDGGVEGGVEGGVPGGVLGSVVTGTAQDQMTVQRITSVQRPKLIRRVAPQYPVTCLRAHLQGTVVVEAVTDIYGRVIDTKIITGHPLFRAAATEAVRKWVYEPYIVNGIPKPVVFTVTVNFRLDGGN